MQDRPLMVFVRRYSLWKGRKMVKTIICLVLGCAQYALGSEPWDMSFELKSHWKDKYLLECGALCYDDDVIQSEFIVGFENGLHFGAWHSLGPDGNWNNNYGDEVDWEAFWKGKMGRYNVCFGMLYFDVVPIFDLPKGDIMNPFLKVSRDFQLETGKSLTPHAMLTAFYPTRGFWEKGCFLRIGATLNWDMTKDFLVSQRTELVYGDGAFKQDSGFFADLGLCLSRRLNKNMIWDIIGLRVTVPMTVHDERETDTVLSSGLRCSWK